MNPPPISSPPAKSSSRGCLLYSGIVIVTFLLVFLTACVITYVMPKKFESTALVQVRPAAHQKGPITPQYLATEFQVMRANLTLKLVVQNLALTTRWNMREEDAIAVLQGIVDAQNIRGTDLIQIKVKHTDPEQARDIAKEIYLAYKKRREYNERKFIEDSLKELEKAIFDQADVVEEKRKQLDNILSRSNGNANDPTVLEVQKEFETQTILLDKMKEKLFIERIDATPYLLNCELHEEPLLPQYPSSPNVTLNLILGAVSGLLLGLFFALLVRLFVGRRHS
jgi:uncharacterized protein involved in exopolysaccharide biosynthesis